MVGNQQTKQARLVRPASRFGVSMLALLAAGSAFAQTASGDGSGKIEEVVVTAQKRSERLQDVPISITALSETRLERMHATDLAGFARSVPNLAVPQAGPTAAQQVSIRGVFSPIGAATVGVYVDDAPVQIRPRGFSGNPNPKIFDLDRIEVLRGPQGTLYGASSLGGTIRYITRQPSLTEFDGRAVTELATTEGGDPSWEVAAAVGGPIVEDKAGFRSSVYYRTDGGYIDKVSPSTGKPVRSNINTERTLALRNALRVDVTDWLRVTPSVYYQRIRSADLPVFTRPPGPYTQNFLVDQPGDDRFVLPSLTIEADVAGARLTSVTSYLRRDNDRVDDYSQLFGELALRGAVPGLLTPGGSRNVTNNTQRNFTEELRLSSTDRDSAWRWVAGLYYQRSKFRLQQNVVEPGLDSLVQSMFGAPISALFGQALLPGSISYSGDERFTETQRAAFGEVGFKITDQIELVVGLRVSRSELELQVLTDGPYNGGPNSADSRAAHKQSETPVTPKYQINYKPDVDTLVYATAAKGFRVGGANLPVPRGPCGPELAALGLTSSPESFQSDSVWSYELGAKKSFFEHRLSINAAAFRIDWDNIQQVVPLSSCGFSFNQNLGKAVSQGFELEAEARPLDNLIFSAGVGLTDAKLSSTVFGAQNPATGTRAILIQSGDRIPYTPRWTFNLAGEYRFPVAALGGYLRAEYQWLDKYQRTPSLPAITYNPIVYEGKSYDFTILRAGLTGDAWEVSIFVENLFDNRPVLYNSVDAYPATLRAQNQTTLRPRTIGVNASMRF